MTLIINHSQLKQCIELSSDLIPIIENAFIQLSNDNTTMPPILRLDIKEYHGETDVKAAYIKVLDSIELGTIIKNPSLGRKTENDITVCDLTGTGVQDTAIARYAFDLAKSKNLGMEIN